MTTALKIINRGASKAKVKSAGVALDSEEITDLLDILNDIIKEWTAIGILQGVEPTYDVDVDIMEPEYATAALKGEVCMRAIAEWGYQGNIAVVAAAASSSYRNMLISLPKKPFVMPDTLPIGSGNYDYLRDEYNDEFFPVNSKENF